MTFEERTQVINTLQEIEKKYPVHEWTLAGIHLWPIIKIEILLHRFNQKNLILPSKPKQRKSFIRQSLHRLHVLYKAIVYKLSLKLKPAEFIFSGAPSHRVNWRQREFNRYFDPIMDFLESKGHSTWMAEYQKLPKKELYKPYRVVELITLLPLFRKKINTVREWQKIKSNNDSFNQALSQILFISKQTEPQLVNKMQTQINAIQSWRLLFRYIFRKTKPLYTVGLCYYSNAMYGMNLAAHDMGVIAVDMQHGTQGTLHPAYTFTEVPTAGYNTLPNEFWCWDIASTNSLKSWGAKAFCVGNPWLDYIKENETEKISHHLPMVLYTLQPIQPILDDYIIGAISQTKQHVEWWLRLHPRMKPAEVAELHKLLKVSGLEDAINIEDASRLPLPTLLQSASVHISKYSGSLVEAALIGTPSIMLEEIGIRSYDYLIREGQAEGLNKQTTESLVQLIQQLINRKKDTTLYSENYKKFINEKLA